MQILREFLTDWKTTGAVAPTSSSTQRVMLDPIDFSRVKLAVELGPGTGCITRAILERLQPDARLLAVEINERFCQQLKSKLPHPQLTVVCGSATDLSAILQQHNLPAADCIVSAIPFTSLPEGLREAIVSAMRAGLAAGGRAVAIQYTSLILPPLLRRHFGSFEVRRSWWNLPPALIYVCKA